MDTTPFTFDIEALRAGAAALGVPLNDTAASKLIHFCSLVMEANTQINLTRIAPKDFVQLHLLDSLSIARVEDLSRDSTLLDAGTGAGFPGVVLAITYPHLEVLMVDSTRKKLNFIEDALHTLGVTNARTLHARLEELGDNPAYSRRFDVVTARALASLTELSSLLLPLITSKGKVVAYKGPGAKGEIDAAQQMLTRVGGRVLQCDEFTLPGTDTARSLVVLGRR
jgi:16S rRNA (guanine527-N7)-methyltransferase